MIELLLLQAMMQTLDERPQPAVPATAFRCTMIGQDGQGKTVQTDVYGTTPVMPDGRKPNDSVPITLGSASAGTALAGSAMVDTLAASTWFRDFEMSRRVGTELHVLRLNLRRAGQSVATWTMRDETWPQDPVAGPEPYRYLAAGLCAADFQPNAAGNTP